jgi:HK97 family phage portal protein
VIEGEDLPAASPPVIWASPWSGWPADWWPPAWNSYGAADSLVDTAWMCIDLNASLLSTMPPYLVLDRPGAPPSADWLRNPDPDLYTSWEEFAKQLFWDYHLGEAFVLATARYATTWPARFHVVPPWAVQVEIYDGLRRYRIGDVDVTPDLLHIRYQSQVGSARGQGPLDVAGARVVSARVLTQYGTKLAAGGGIPPGVLKHSEEIGEAAAAKIKAQWVAARMSAIGEPAVLEGGLEWEPTQVNPRDMALLDLLQFNEARIAYLLGVPGFLVGLPSAPGESMTYSNVTQVFDYHWRAGLRPKAASVMAALSEWLLPRGTRVEVNRDAYVEPPPLERAQTAQILNGIVDPATGRPALSVDEIRAAERLSNSDPADLSAGVLR